MSDSLIDAWLAASTTIPGTRKADAIRAMNLALGTRYTMSRINQWRSGARVPSAAAMRYMAAEAVQWVLAQEGLTSIEDESLDRIAARLTVPGRC